MRINAVVATRMTSSRLPGKVLLDLCGKPALVRLIERLRQSRYIQEIIIATTTNATDDIVAQTAKEAGVQFYRGSEEDVLKRTVEAAEAFQTDYIVQVTSDCPLIDAVTIDASIERIMEHPYLDYVGNHLVRTYPLGFSSEVFRTQALRHVERTVSDPAVHEHVSLYFYEHPELYHLSNVEAAHYLRHPEYRLTLDTQEDYTLIRQVFEKLYPVNPHFSLYDIVKLIESDRSMLEINQTIRQKTAR
ncbi:glycosyltransferase family protein [Paenibacillus alginolyticus]|uniref:Glycosyltransferase family protein n=1 Tax=Paenibacillus alginolyticus TaxID=59839 RepID=A0ABT4G856_9BACL|nr:glycosyltransferase family protein [Paenibacillus alginolyticus]MCY9692368.1 glycosyltransferase family protein [Paenibacillus alginolyticus]MEC0143659.1 glycosyltransferase family protein [Paenibacillus alginolyticus]